MYKSKSNLKQIFVLLKNLIVSNFIWKQKHPFVIILYVVFSTIIF